MRRRLLAVLAAVAVAAWAGADDGAWAQAPAPAGRGYVDVHAHLFGRVQTEAGGPAIVPAPGTPRGRHGPRREAGPPAEAAVDYPAAARNLVDHMDRYGVAKALIMPPPRTVQNVERDELANLLKVAAQHPGRLAVAGGGDVLNPLIHRYPASEVNPDLRKRFAEAAEQLLKSGVKAFGEIAALHLSFYAEHPFEQAPPDHPLLLALAEVAAKHGVAIDLHMEAVAADMPLPAGFAKPRSGAPATLKANLPGLERLLRHDRKARIVWQHIGWDNTGHMTVERLRPLLGQHPNLYLALRVEERVTALDGRPMPNRIVDANWRITPEWQAFLATFPDRFVIGSDEFFGVPGKSPRFPRSFEETWKILDQLPPALAGRIGRDNALRIYGLQ